MLWDPDPRVENSVFLLSNINQPNPAFSTFLQLFQVSDSFEKTLMMGKIEDKRRRGMTEDEMVGWHHQLDGHEFE